MGNTVGVFAVFGGQGFFAVIQQCQICTGQHADGNAHDQFKNHQTKEVVSKVQPEIACTMRCCTYQQGKSASHDISQITGRCFQHDNTSCVHGLQIEYLRKTQSLALKERHYHRHNQHEHMKESESVDYVYVSS